MTLSLTSLAEIVIGASFLTALAIFSLRSGSTSTTTTGGTTTGESKAGKKKKKKKNAPGNGNSVQLQGNAAATGTAVIEGAQNIKREVQDGVEGVVKAVKGVSKVIEEKSTVGKKKIKRVPFVMEDAPVIPLPPRTTVPAPNGTAPSFAKIASPNSTPLPPPTTASSKPSKVKSTKSNPLSDMRDMEVDPEEETKRVMKIIDSRPDVNGTEEWREWSAKNGNGNGVSEEDLYEDSGEAKEVEGDWEVAKKRPSSPPSPLLFALTTSTGPTSRTAPSLNISGSSSAFATSNPAPRSIPGLSSSALGALTKKQRENSKQSSKKALEKEDAERERNERLAAHRKELDRTRCVLSSPSLLPETDRLSGRVRLIEQQRAAAKGKPKPRSENLKDLQKSGAMSAKVQSGGMKGSLDGQGKLVWD